MALEKFITYLLVHLKDQEKAHAVLNKLVSLAYNNVYELLTIAGYTKQDVYEQKPSVTALVKLEMADLLMATHITEEELDSFSKELVDDVFDRAYKSKEVTTALLAEYIDLMNAAFVPNDVSNEGLKLLMLRCTEASESIQTINQDISKNDFEEHMKDVVTGIADEVYNFFFSRGYNLDYAPLTNYTYETIVALLTEGELDDSPLGFNLDVKEGFTDFKYFANDFYDKDLRRKVFAFIIKEKSNLTLEAAKDLADAFTSLHATNYDAWLENVVLMLKEKYGTSLAEGLFIVNLSMIMLIYLRDPEAEYYLSDIYLPLDNAVLDVLICDFNLNSFDLKKLDFNSYFIYMQYLKRELGILYFVYFKILKIIEN